MNNTPNQNTGIRKIITTCCLLAVFLFAASIARADVPSNRITYIDFNMNSPGDHSGSSMQSRYEQMIRELRAATGSTFRQDVLSTQHTNNPGLIRIRFRNGATQMLLWISPQELYVRGYTDNDGQTFQFPDPEYSLSDQLRSLRYEGGQVNTLLVGSNYNDLSGRDGANRDRNATPFNYNAFWNSFFNLAFMHDPRGARLRECAQSLMTMIQITSEAARFNDVYNLMHDAMGSGDYRGLPAFQQRLENEWGAMSEWAFLISNNPGAGPLLLRQANANNGNNPFAAPNDLILRSWADLQRYVRVLLNAPSGLGNGGSGGNWDRTEL